jgi:hypothetical protein
MSDQSSLLDLNAVLDGNFKVRGVDNLRVVDISSWPTIPGFFVTTPTYMVSLLMGIEVITDHFPDIGKGSGRHNGCRRIQANKVELGLDNRPGVLIVE